MNTINLLINVVLINTSFLEQYKDLSDHLRNKTMVGTDTDMLLCSSNSDFDFNVCEVFLGYEKFRFSRTNKSKYVLFMKLHGLTEKDMYRISRLYCLGINIFNSVIKKFGNKTFENRKVISEFGVDFEISIYEYMDYNAFNAIIQKIHNSTIKLDGCTNIMITPGPIIGYDVLRTRVVKSKRSIVYMGLAIEQRLLARFIILPVIKKTIKYELILFRKKCTKIEPDAFDISHPDKENSICGLVKVRHAISYLSFYSITLKEIHLDKKRELKILESRKIDLSKHKIYFLQFNASLFPEYFCIYLTMNIETKTQVTHLSFHTKDKKIEPKEFDFSVFSQMVKELHHYEEVGLGYFEFRIDFYNITFTNELTAQKTLSTIYKSFFNEYQTDLKEQTFWIMKERLLQLFARYKINYQVVLNEVDIKSQNPAQRQKCAAKQYDVVVGYKYCVSNNFCRENHDFCRELYNDGILKRHESLCYFELNSLDKIFISYKEPVRFFMNILNDEQELLARVYFFIYTKTSSLKVAVSIDYCIFLGFLVNLQEDISKILCQET